MPVKASSKSNDHPYPKEIILASGAVQQVVQMERLEWMEVREQNRHQQKNGILGSSLPQAMPDGGDTESQGRSSLTEDLKDS